MLLGHNFLTRNARKPCFHCKTRRLAASFEGLNRSLAQSPGKLMELLSDIINQHSCELSQQQRGL